MNVPNSNLLFESLHSSERMFLAEELESVLLPVRSVLFEAERRPRYIHFITSGLASVVASMANGEAVEVGLLGREGVPGTTYLLGPQLGFARCFMQVSGSGRRIGFRRFEQAMGKYPSLRQRVLEHVQYETFTSNQLSACNAIHSVEQRLSRWLLMATDRLNQVNVPLTQEFLAVMLGTRRSTVTLVAGLLQCDGLIEYQRGQVTILDRARLEDAACECYSVTRRLFVNLYSGTPRQTR